MPDMKYLLHALIVGAYFITSDHIGNDGVDTTRFLRELRMRATFHDVEIPAYNVGARLKQEAQSYKPLLASIRQPLGLRR